MKTRQQLFDAAYFGLESQGWRKSKTSYYDDDGFKASECAYRGPNGCKCAIGWNIPDKSYRATMEVWNIANTGVESAFTAAGIHPDDTKWAVNMQARHDNGSPGDAMKDRFIAFAAEHGLTVPVTA